MNASARVPAASDGKEMLTLVMAVLTLLPQEPSDPMDPSNLGEYRNYLLDAVYAAPFRPPGDRSWDLVLDKFFDAVSRQEAAVLPGNPFGNESRSWVERLGSCHRGIGNYDLALFAYEVVERRPDTRSHCGNAHAQARLRSLVQQGICLEGLGRHREAIDRYFRALEELSLAWNDEGAFRRIVDLYERLGSIRALRRRLDLRDWDAMEALPWQRDRWAQWWLINSISCSEVLRGILACRDAAALGNWDELLEALRRGQSTWEVLRILGEHPREVLPRVLVAWHEADPDYRRRLTEVLAIFRSPEAIRFLTDELRVLPEPDERENLILELNRAGPLGRAALEVLKQSGDFLAEEIVELQTRWITRRLEQRIFSLPPSVIVFPPLPQITPLK